MSTYTRTETNTYTEARARYVNDKIYDDMQAMARRGLISDERVSRMRGDIKYILDHQAMSYFQFQFKLPDGTSKALQYDLKDDGSLYGDDNSGGISYWGLPKGTTVTLLVHLNTNSSNYKKVNKKLNDDGWGTGSSIEGSKNEDKSFSKDRYGVVRNKINW